MRWLIEQREAATPYEMEKACDDMDRLLGGGIFVERDLAISCRFLG
jgi:hypothetical protein